LLVGDEARAARPCNRKGPRLGKAGALWAWRSVPLLRDTEWKRWPFGMVPTAFRPSPPQAAIPRHHGAILQRDASILLSSDVLPRKRPQCLSNTFANRPARLRTPSFRRMFLLWNSAVRGLMSKARAASLLLAPIDICASIARSRGVSR